MTGMYERIVRRITINTDGCWVFTGAIRNGYGVVGRGGRGEGTEYCHRATYMHDVGPIPPGLELDHLCRTRACCNPAHLEPVTRAENMRRGARWANPPTHCKWGHEFTPENTIRSPRQRHCRTCMAERKARKRTAA